MTGLPWLPNISSASAAGWKSAVGNYNKFVGSFERNVLSAGAQA